MEHGVDDLREGDSVTSADPERLPATQQASPARARTEWFATVPGLLAVATVLLYAVGIISQLGRLRALDLDVQRTFALIPLQRNLALSVGAVAGFISYILWITIGAIVGYALLPTDERARYIGSLQKARDLPTSNLHTPSKETQFAGQEVGAEGVTTHSDTPELTQGSRSALERWRLRLLGGVGLLYVPWLVLVLCFTAWPILIALPLVFLAIKGMRSALRRYTGVFDSSPLAANALAWLMGAAVGAAVAGYFMPSPFECVTLNRVKGAPIAGRLMVNSDGTWYVVPDGVRGRYVALPSDKVTLADLHTTKGRYVKPSLMDAIGVDWSWFTVHKPPACGRSGET